jgi:cell fate regulator YaaT (PSP1 superfamily)
MADLGTAQILTGAWSPPATIDEARALARKRFKARLQRGEKIGDCGCSDDEAVVGPADGSPAECVVGVRFRDSGRTYYFRSELGDVGVGDWLVVATARGEEAGQVVIAPHQVRRALLQGELNPVLRRLTPEEIDRMDARRRGDADAVRIFGERTRARQIGIKPISAMHSFDGASLSLNYSIPDREAAPDSSQLQDLADDLAGALGCRVELRQVGPRDEARLLGGLGRCGRTLCCASWLPVFPEISMSMAKNQDLPLNPSKVSGVCGRLLCCLSYENEQYRQMKAVMPKLGQVIETPGGAGRVVSMHLMRELVTVRLEEGDLEVTFRSEELGLGLPQTSTENGASSERLERAEESPAAAPSIAVGDEAGGRRRRRRRGGRRSPSQG